MAMAATGGKEEEGGHRGRRRVSSDKKKKEPVARSPTPPPLEPQPLLRISLERAAAHDATPVTRARGRPALLPSDGPLPLPDATAKPPDAAAVTLRRRRRKP
jgi:hypothetical protein